MDKIDRNGTFYWTTKSTQRVLREDDADFDDFDDFDDDFDDDDSLCAGPTTEESAKVRRRRSDDLAKVVELVLSLSKKRGRGQHRTPTTPTRSRCVVVGVVASRVGRGGWHRVALPGRGGDVRRTDATRVRGRRRFFGGLFSGRVRGEHGLGHVRVRPNDSRRRRRKLGVERGRWV